MKRFISLLLIAVTLALLLCSCHGIEEKNAFEIPENFDDAKEYNITFWAKNENNSSQREVYKQAIDSFEAIYPNIHVTIKHYTSYDDIYNDVLTNIQTDTTPNVCITYPDHIATYIEGTNTVISLNELVIDSKYGLGGSEVKFDAPTYD